MRPFSKRLLKGHWLLAVAAVLAILGLAGVLYATAGPIVRALLVWLLLSATITVVTTILTALVLVKMPADYFSKNRECEFLSDRHLVIRWIGRVVKNLLGLLLVALGVVMAIPAVPGPGLLTIVFGILLLDLPGKRRLERCVISRPVVLDAVNRLRRRYGAAPVVVE
jgi:hypothetical protein